MANGENDQIRSVSLVCLQVVGTSVCVCQFQAGPRKRRGYVFDPTLTVDPRLAECVLVALLVPVNLVPVTKLLGRHRSSLAHGDVASVLCVGKEALYVYASMP